VIETATDACSVALFRDGEVVAAQHELIGRGHAERLIALIANLPHGGQADHILVSCGPGSFTGVRVGVAAARGLALGWNCAVTGYSTLAAIAAQAFDQRVDDELAVVMHGGHGEVFVQRFTRAPFRALNALESVSVQVAVDTIPTQDVVGTAADALVAARGYGRAVAHRLAAPSAQLLPIDFLTLAPAPIYGRGADARPMS